MSGRHGVAVLGSGILTALAAEIGRRLLTPRPAAPDPAAVDLRDHFSAADIARGRAFARPQARIELARSGLQTILLSRVVARPPGALTERSRSSARPAIDAALAAAGLSLGLAVPGLPLRAIARRRALAVGLATGTWRAWATDLGKAAVIQTAFSGMLGAGAVRVSQRYPRHWWLPAAGGTIVLGAALGALAPVLLEPIFNDFTPLPDGETRADVLALAAAAGVSVGQVYTVDASRRTSAANAYVSGLGPTKRVVLYDTMLDRYSREEIRLVVAHELGHVRHRDVARNLAFAAIIAPALTFATQHAGAALSGTPPDAPLRAGRLPALMLAAGLVSAPLSPSAAGLSRALERRADRFSLELAGAPEAFVSFERRASLQNLSDLQPGWIARRLASHPPAVERIGAALEYAGEPDPPTSGGGPPDVS